MALWKNSQVRELLIKRFNNKLLNKIREAQKIFDNYQECLDASDIVVFWS